MGDPEARTVQRTTNFSGEASRPSRYSEKALKSSDGKETNFIHFMTKRKLRRLVYVVFCPYTAHLNDFLLGKKKSTNQIFFYGVSGQNILHLRYSVSCIESPGH